MTDLGLYLVYTRNEQITIFATKNKKGKEREIC